MKKTGLCILILLISSSVSAYEVSSEQAYQKASQYAKTEALSVYERPIIYLGTEFWVVKLSGKSPRYIAIDASDSSITPLTEESILEKLIETFMVAEGLGDLVQDSNFLLGTSGQQKIYNLKSQFESVESNINLIDTESILSSEVLSMLNSIKSDLSTAVSSSMDKASSNVSSRFNSLKDFVQNPRYSRISSVRQDLSYGFAVFDEALEDSIDVINQIGALKTTVQTIRNSEDDTVKESVPAEVASVIVGTITTPNPSEIQNLRFSLNQSLQTIESNVFEVAEVFPSTYAASSVDRIYEMDATAIMNSISTKVLTIIQNSDYFSQKYGFDVKQLQQDWQTAVENLQSGKFQEAKVGFEQIHAKVDSISMVITPDNQTPGQTETDYSVLVNTLIILIAGLAAIILLFKEKDTIAGIFSGEKDEQEDYYYP